MATGLFNLKQVNQAIQQGGWPNQKPIAVNYLVVAGGGAGGDNPGSAYNGGGGGGGLLQGSIPVTSGTSYTVTVGAGSGRFGTAGAASVLGAITSTGGGSGARNNIQSAYSGGSGGGGSSDSTRLIGGAGIFGQGNAGGNGVSTSAGGGGGGAGTVGLNGVSTVGGNGGAGIASDISGTRTPYAGGGGGSGTTQGSGGAGGGTAAGGADAAANTGGGGGSGAGFGNAAAGGSGIVIISYPDIYAAPSSSSGATASTSGSGSLFVSGTYQSYVQYPANAAFAFGTGSFTYECWFYATATSGNCLINFGIPNNAGSFAVFFFSGTLYVRVDGTGNDLTYVPSGITGAWHHIAVVRNGTALTVYLDGVSVVSGTRSNNITQNQPQVGQADSGTGWPFNGYMSNIRIVKGVAVYTGNFSSYLPTSPLNATQSAGPTGSNINAITGTQTSLLLPTVSPSAYNDISTNSFSPTVVGTTSWNQLSPFATGLGYKNRVYTYTTSGTFTLTI